MYMVLVVQSIFVLTLRLFLGNEVGKTRVGNLDVDVALVNGVYKESKRKAIIIAANLK